MTFFAFLYQYKTFFRTLSIFRSKAKFQNYGNPFIKHDPTRQKICNTIRRKDIYKKLEYNKELITL